MSTEMQAHLRKYVEDGIQQKVRLNNKILDYKKQEHKTRERAIDQRALETKFKAENRPQDRIDLVVNRKERDMELLDNIQRVIGESEAQMEGVTLRMNAHLEELADIEIQTGGFITHAIGADKETTLDKETMIVQFKPGGHAEMPIATRIGKWKDSSQLSIKKIKKAGV